MWSLDWSRDAVDVVAGTGMLDRNSAGVVLYDIEAETVKVSKHCHEDDVNAVRSAPFCSCVVR